MALIDSTYVKDRFENWVKYCTPTGSKTADEVLQLKIDLAIYEFNGYLNLVDTDMTPSLKVHLFNIVRKRIWDIKHGDTVFSKNSKPQILVDYNATMDALVKGLIGNDNIKIDARDRLFNKSFINNSDAAD